MKRVIPFFVLLSSPAMADTMPQLDFGNKLLTAQVVWGALIFAAFYLLVSRWALPKVGSILEMRAGTIAADLQQAQAAKVRADAAVAELTAARARAFAESAARIAAAAQAAKAAAAEQASAQAAQLDAQLAESEARIAAAHAAAMGALKGIATDTARAVLARAANGFAQDAWVDDAVAAVLVERGLSHAA